MPVEGYGTDIAPHHESSRHVPSSDLPQVRQDDLGRLRPARRRRTRGVRTGDRCQAETSGPGFLARCSAADLGKTSGSRPASPRRHGPQPGLGQATPDEARHGTGRHPDPALPSSGDVAAKSTRTPAGPRTAGWLPGEAPPTSSGCAVGEPRRRPGAARQVSEGRARSRTVHVVETTLSTLASGTGRSTPSIKPAPSWMPSRCCCAPAEQVCELHGRYRSCRRVVGGAEAGPISSTSRRAVVRLVAAVWYSEAAVGGLTAPPARPTTVVHHHPSVAQGGLHPGQRWPR